MKFHFSIHAISFTCALLFTPYAQADFTFTEANGKLSLHEDGEPVFDYNFEMVPPPEGVDEKYRRSGYLHPVYGLDGQVVTQDFPSDHYHHRGVFWGWPKSTYDAKLFNNWEMTTAKQYFESWQDKTRTRDYARFTVQNRWSFIEDSDTPIIRETMTVTAHTKKRKTRSIDFHLQLENVTGKPFTLLGATNKGYGGFNYRPDAVNKPLHFHTALGPQEKDSLNLDSPWVDVSWKDNAKNAAAGVAVFQHPKNPEYPHFGWLIRHYGFNGAAWPHLNEYIIAPGGTLDLRYRMVIHSGNAESVNIEKLFKKFTRKASR
jgi:hypothetical protein